MNAVSTQELTWMLGGSMAISSIGISAVPGEDGSYLTSSTFGNTLKITPE